MSHFHQKPNDVIHFYWKWRISIGQTYDETIIGHLWKRQFKRIFNYKLSSARQIVDNVYGIMSSVQFYQIKMEFQILQWRVHYCIHFKEEGSHKELIILPEEHFILKINMRIDVCIYIKFWILVGRPVWHIIIFDTTVSGLKIWSWSSLN